MSVTLICPIKNTQELPPGVLRELDIHLPVGTAAAYSMSIWWLHSTNKGLGKGGEQRDPGRPPNFQNTEKSANQSNQFLRKKKSRAYEGHKFQSQQEDLPSRNQLFFLPSDPPLRFGFMHPPCSQQQHISRYMCNEESTRWCWLMAGGCTEEAATEIHIW